MSNIKIICDSGCDLPVNIQKELDLHVLPLFVIRDGIEYKDGIDIFAKEFYENMRKGYIYTTAQVSLDTFVQVFEEYAEANIPILYISFSSGISGTFGSSKIACDMVKEKYPDARLEVVDSKCASLGCGYAIYLTAKFASTGASLEEVAEKAKFYSSSIGHVFTVDDVGYLARGGRVSKTSAMLASTLDIRPILDVQDGNLCPVKKVRGAKKVYQAMVELMRQRSVNPGKHQVWISHADAIDKVEILKKLIEKEFGAKEFVINNIGTVIGAHVGPGTLAVFFITKEE